MRPSPSPSALGQAVFDLRNVRGWTRTELALRASMHRNYVGELERGRRNPTLNVITRLAAALETTTSQLVLDAENCDRRAALLAQRARRR